MSDFLARLFGVITVEERDGHIRISGIPADVISYEIKKMWETGRINSYMFTTTGRNHFSFNRFFAIEILYMIEVLLRDSKRYAVKKALTEIARQLKSKTWLRHTYEHHPGILDWSILSQFPLKAKPEQLEFMKTFDAMVPKMGLYGFYLAAAPGSGKTYMGAAVARMSRKKLRVVICPGKAVSTVWDESLKEWFPATPPYIIGSGEKYAGQADVVCSFDMLEHLDRFLLTHKDSDNMFIVIDESHYINEIDAQRTQISIDLLRKFRCLSLRLSGTAWKAQGHEAIPYLMSIDPMFDTDAQERMYRIFGKDVRKGGDIFAHRLGLSVYKIDKEAVGGKRPIELKIPVSLPNPDRYLISTIRADMGVYIGERLGFYERNLEEHYSVFDAAIGTFRASVKGTPREADLDRYVEYVRMLNKYHGRADFKEIIVWCNKFERDVILPALPSALREKFKKSKTVIKYVQYTVMGEALANIVGKRREECAREVAGALDVAKYVNEAEKKTLIYSSYVSVIKDTKNRLDRQGFQSSIVYQETNRNLPAILKRFLNDVNENPLFATFKSMGDAIDGLQRVANTILMLDIPFRRYLFDQTAARIDRMGQTTQTYILLPFLDTGSIPNISTRTTDIMMAAEEQVAIMMGGGKLENAPPGLNDALFVTTEEREVSVSFKRVARKAL